MNYNILFAKQTGEFVSAIPLLNATQDARKLSDPLTKASHQLGLSTEWNFEEIEIPYVREDLKGRFCVAVICVYQLSFDNETLRACVETNSMKMTPPICPNIFFIKQHNPLTSSTISLLHAIYNVINESLVEPKSHLYNLYKHILPLNPWERGIFLEMGGPQMNTSWCCDRNKAVVPKRFPYTEAGLYQGLYHFITFIKLHGNLYMLDGRNMAPVNLGRKTDLIPWTIRHATQIVKVPGSIYVGFYGLCRLERPTDSICEDVRVREGIRGLFVPNY